MRCRLLIVSIVAFLLVVVALAYRVVFFPWWRLPDRSAEDIERRFQQLESWARLRRGAADSSSLSQALARLRASSMQRPQELLRQSSRARDGLPLLPWQQLDAHGQVALALLHDWHAKQGGFAASSCSNVCTEAREGAFQCAIELNRLGTLALVTASDGQPHAVDAVLHLAHVLRNSGHHAEFLVGTLLAEKAGDWARSRRVKPWSTFHELAPRAAEVLPAFARDRWCEFAHLRASRPAATWLDFAVETNTAKPEHLTAPFGIVRPERERLVALDTAASVVLAAAVHGSDLQRMAGAVERETLAAQEVLRTTPLEAFAPTIERAARVISTFHELHKRGD